MSGPAQSCKAIIHSLRMTSLILIPVIAKLVRLEDTGVTAALLASQQVLHYAYSGISSNL